MNDEQPENLDFRSLEIGENKEQELLSVFPETWSEGGKINFEGPGEWWIRQNQAIKMTMENWKKKALSENGDTCHFPM